MFFLGSWSFLKFRIPNNGCFDDKSVHDFQKRLLRKELESAKEEWRKSREKLTEARQDAKRKIPFKCLPSVVLYTKHDVRQVRITRKRKLDDKLFRLSREQDRPLFNVHNKVSYTFFCKNKNILIAQNVSDLEVFLFTYIEKAKKMKKLKIFPPKGDFWAIIG